MNLGAKKLILLALLTSSVAAHAGWSEKAWPADSRFRLSPNDYLVVSNLWAVKVEEEIELVASAGDFIPSFDLRIQGSALTPMPIYTNSNTRTITNVYYQDIVADISQTGTEQPLWTFTNVAETVNSTAFFLGSGTNFTEVKVNVKRTRIGTPVNETWRLDVPQIWAYDTYMAMRERQAIIDAATNSVEEFAREEISDFAKPRFYRNPRRMLVYAKQWISQNAKYFVDKSAKDGDTYNDWLQDRRANGPIEITSNAEGESVLGSQYPIELPTLTVDALLENLSDYLPFETVATNDVDENILSAYEEIRPLDKFRHYFEYTPEKLHELGGWRDGIFPEVDTKYVFQHDFEAWDAAQPQNQRQRIFEIQDNGVENTLIGFDVDPPVTNITSILTTPLGMELYASNVFDVVTIYSTNFIPQVLINNAFTSAYEEAVSYRVLTNRLEVGYKRWLAPSGTRYPVWYDFPTNRPTDRIVVGSYTFERGTNDEPYVLEYTDEALEASWEAWGDLVEYAEAEQFSPGVQDRYYNVTQGPARSSPFASTDEYGYKHIPRIFAELTETQAPAIVGKDGNAPGSTWQEMLINGAGDDTESAGIAWGRAVEDIRQTIRTVSPTNFGVRFASGIKITDTVTFSEDYIDYGAVFSLFVPGSFTVETNVIASAISSQPSFYGGNVIVSTNLVVTIDLSDAGGGQELFPYAYRRAIDTWGYPVSDGLTREEALPVDDYSVVNYSPFDITLRTPSYPGDPPGIPPPPDENYIYFTQNLSAFRYAAFWVFDWAVDGGLSYTEIPE